MVVSVVLDSSTVMTPSVPTVSIALAIRPPMFSSPEETVPTRAMSSLPLTGWEFCLMVSTATLMALAMPLFMTTGLAPATRFFRPSLMMAWASRVAVVVPSPATSLVLVETSLTIWAPMFSNGSSSSISLAMVTPSLVTRGVP